jgi:general secretion pathway protein D
VFVEAMIVEASVDGLRELGARWRVTARKDGEPVFIGGVGAIDNEQLLNIVNGLSGLTLGGIGNLFNITVVDPATGQNRTITVPGYAALFSLSDFRNLVNVLSTPQILTSDNQEAEIVVGENVPIVARRDVGTTGASVLSSAIERRDVGIKLRITPHITEGEAVRLEIYQEISAVKDTPPDTDATAILTEVGPTLTLRSTKTSVVVNDGQTIVIGGLMSERTDNTVDKVPVLGDIPVLGYLFKNTSARKQKTNLLVFISPSVVKGGEGMAKLTEEKKEEFGRQETRSAYKASELIVKFRKGVRAEEAQAIIRARGWSVISNPRELLYVVRISPSEEPNEAAAGLSGQLQVEYAEPNYILKID